MYKRQGNPHAVVFLDDVENLKIEEIGPRFEQHERFPDRVNTEFVERIDRKNLKMRVWERGSGETMACGTGACATAVAAILNGYACLLYTSLWFRYDLRIRRRGFCPGSGERAGAEDGAGGAATGKMSFSLYNISLLAY